MDPDHHVIRRADCSRLIIVMDIVLIVDIAIYRTELSQTAGWHISRHTFQHFMK